MAWTSSPSYFLRFLSFARGQYPRTAPTRKIQNLSHFLKVYQRVILKAGFEFFSVITRCNALISFKQAVKIAQIIKAAG